MERDAAITGLNALADGLRLSLLRALAREDQAGLSAGELARILDVVPSTLSGPLRVLREAGLIERRKRGRLAVYRMERAALAELSGYVAHLAAPA